MTGEAQSEPEKLEPLTAEEMQKVAQVIEIFNLSENAAQLALRKNNFMLDDTVAKLLSQETFLSSVVEEAAKMNPPTAPKKAVPAPMDLN